MTTATPFSLVGRLTLLADLDCWAARSKTGPDPEARRAANTAMGQIDVMLRELQLMRARLVSEIRAADDVNAAWVDALLAGRKAAGDA